MGALVPFDHLEPAVSRTLRRPSLRAGTVGLALVALATAGAAPASAGPGPDTIALPTGSLPEGITTGPGDTFYAGARKDGAVRQYSTRTGRLVRTIVQPRQGEVAVGLLYDAATSRLYVAGGATGDLTVYDARNGKVLYTANAGANRFINDVTVTGTGAYFTDSTRAEVLEVRFSGGKLPRSSTFRRIALRGDYVQPEGFGLNGIRDLSGGRLLVVSGGKLYVVDPRNGNTNEVEQAGRPLTGGDGIELDGRLLYVVNGYGGDEVAVLRLSQTGGSATSVFVLDENDTTSDLDRPTTGAIVDGDLYVVNGRFGTIGNGTGANVTFSVSKLDL